MYVKEANPILLHFRFMKDAFNFQPPPPGLWDIVLNWGGGGGGGIQNFSKFSIGTKKVGGRGSQWPCPNSIA